MAVKFTVIRIEVVKCCGVCSDVTQKQPRATWNQIIFLERDLAGAVGALDGHAP